MKARLFLLLVVVFATLSCQRKELELVEESIPETDYYQTNYPDDGVVRVTVAGSSTYRTVDSETISQMGIYINYPDPSVDDSYGGYAYLLNNDGVWESYSSSDYTTFKELLWRNESDEAQIGAISLYDKVQPYWLTDDTFVTNVHNAQLTLEGLEKSDMLFGQRTVVPYSDLNQNGELEVDLQHMMAKLDITLNIGNQHAGKAITSVIVSGTDGYYTFVKSTASVEGTEVNEKYNIYSYQSEFVASSSESSGWAKYEAIVVPQSVSAYGFSVNVKVAGVTYSWYSPQSISFAQGSYNTLEFNLDSSLTQVGEMGSWSWN
ncbi:MAG: fimbrillin family protein [Rikenellaceae bacterium]